MQQQKPRAVPVVGRGRLAGVGGADSALERTSIAADRGDDAESFGPDHNNTICAG